jgi:copper chaperone
MIAFRVDDMTCGHCVASVTRAVKDADAAAEVRIDLDAHRVEVASTLPAERVAQAIRDAGFTPQAPAA